MKVLKRIARLAATLLLAMSVATSAVSVGAQAATSATASVAQPKASTKTGTYQYNISVSLTCDTKGATIYYTTDGSYPTIESNVYTGSIRIKGEAGKSVTTILRAVAIKTGYEPSEITEAIYTIEIPEEPVIEYMEITSNPTKTRYNKGDELSLSGGKIVVSYSDGTYVTLNMKKSMISGFNTNTAGQKKVTVTYGGYTDTFTITVVSSSGQSNTNINKDYDDDDIITEDTVNPRISGTAIKGWGNIENALSQIEEGNSTVIVLNESPSVPADVIRAAAKNTLDLTFTVTEDIQWNLNTAEISTKTVPSIGLGIRTNAISTLETPIREMGGKEAFRLHVNSDNKLGASLCIDLDKKYGDTYASLFRYDHDTDKLVLVDTQRTTATGFVTLVPDESGDYIIIADQETKIIGDLDNNMRVNAFDAAMLLRMIVNGTEATRKTDFDKNGVINALDVSKMLRYIVNH